MTTPLVSCVTVARGSLPGLKEAVRCYCEQTYERRELIVAVARDERYLRAVEAFVSSLGRGDIRVLAPDESRGADPMAEALRAASGEFVCVWVDNERSHSARLQVQVNHLTTSGAAWSVMGERLIFLLPERMVYWVAATGAAEAARRYGVAETLMARAGEAAERWGRLLDVEGEAVPAEPHRMPADASFLAVRVFGELLDPHARPDEALLKETSRDHDACRARAELFRIALAQSRLPRPCLVRALSGNGEFVTVDVN